MIQDMSFSETLSREQQRIEHTRAFMELSKAQPRKRKRKGPYLPKNPISAYLFYVAEQRVKNTGKHSEVCIVLPSLLNSVEIVRPSGQGNRCPVEIFE